MINKQMIIFLIVAQTILVLFNLVAYWLLISFFPGLDTYKTILLTALIVLAVSFLAFTIASFKFENFILRWGTIISSVWIVTNFYFLLNSLVALIIYLILPFGLVYYGLAASLVTLGLTIYGIINARVTRVTKITVTLPNLPSFWKGKTAIMVSDLHLGHVLQERFAKKIVRMINKESPEVVFLPGDFFDSVYTNFQSLANEFKAINAPSGSYFCSGNHELYVNYAECEQALKNAGVKILENQLVEVNGLQIAGAAYKHDVMPDLAENLRKMNLNHSKPSILLKHVPLQIQEVSEAGFNLVLGGHSHHGQIWPGRLITKPFFKGYDYGFKMFKNLQVYTSSGAGTWGPPMRVFTKAEIVKIIFQ
jgi:predicted MPP superfamily phosphohydrolase